jgi:hypothetical protein
VQRHEASAWAKKEMAITDGKVALAVSTHGLGCEIALLNFGESMAGGRSAVRELTGRKVSMLTAIDDQITIRTCT